MNFIEKVLQSCVQKGYQESIALNVVSVEQVTLDLPVIGDKSAVLGLSSIETP